MFLPAKTVTFQPLPSDFTIGPYLRRILFYTLARPVYARFATPFYPVPFFISRDFTSLLLRLHFIVTRYYFSIWIIHRRPYSPSVRIYGGFSRRFFFNLPFCPQTSSVHSHSSRLRRRFACLFLRRLCSACEAWTSGSTEQRAVLVRVNIYSYAAFTLSPSSFTTLRSFTSLPSTSFSS